MKAKLLIASLALVAAHSALAQARPDQIEPALNCPPSHPLGLDYKPAVLVMRAPRAEPNFRTISYDFTWEAPERQRYFKWDPTIKGQAQTPLTFSIQTRFFVPTSGIGAQYPYGDQVFSGAEWYGNMPWQRSLKVEEGSDGSKGVSFSSSNAALFEPLKIYTAGARLTSRDSLRANGWEFETKYVLGTRSPAYNAIHYDTVPCAYGVGIGLKENYVAAIPRNTARLPFTKKCLVITHGYDAQWLQEMVEGGRLSNPADPPQLTPPPGRTIIVEKAVDSGGTGGFVNNKPSPGSSKVPGTITDGPTPYKPAVDGNMVPIPGPDTTWIDRILGSDKIHADPARFSGAWCKDTA